MYRKIFKVLGFLFCFFVSGAEGQTVLNSDTVSLSLDEAEQRFISQNLELIAAHYNIDIAHAAMLQSKAWYNPNVSYSQGLYDNTYKKFLNNSSNGEIDVQVRQLLSIAGKHTHAVRLAKLDQEKSELAYQEVMRSLMFELFDTYYDLLASQQKVKLFSFEAKNLEKLIAAGEQQLRLGNIAGNEVVRLKTELQDIRNASISEEQNLYKVQQELKIMLNYPYTVFPVAKADHRSVSALPDLQQTILSAEQNRPDLKLSGKEVQYQQQNLKLQRSVRVPDLSIGAEYDQSASYVPHYYGIGVSMDLPLFNRNQGPVRAASIQIRQAEAMDSLQHHRVQNEVAGAYLTLEKIKTELDHLDKNYDPDLESLIGSAIQNYNKHYISLLEFLDQLRSYANAKIGLIELNADYYKAIQNLNYSAGTRIIK